jgi:MSHA biogenesis protein MshI
MMSIFGRTEKGGGKTGIYRPADGFAAAQVMQGAAGGKPVLAHCEYQQARDHDAIARAARAIPDRRLPAVCVLPSDKYTMLLVEAPEVPADELRAAVRWRVRDLIDFHIDDAVLDVFQMPSRRPGSHGQMMYAIVARSDGVRAEIDVAEDAGLKLRAIDILELSLRNIGLLLDKDERGIALMYLAEHTGVMLVIRQGALYLARRLETGVQTLADADGLRSELIDGLALEARRSLDYFESHFEQSSVPVIYTAGLQSPDLDQMAGELGLSVHNIELNSLFETQADYDDELSRRCLPAIGAALRHEEVTL